MRKELAKRQNRHRAMRGQAGNRTAIGLTLGLVAAVALYVGLRIVGIVR